ncbi:MAG: ABC transporter ATP-binding protein [Deltaproteobacteria bacterium RIFCSPLOWO2_02_FULL_53_8]|nr:MAG: ABC transporter ATP-binding protein [Deltaproteobacteria bacterium RIFCSPLOWO2_02_FULL_53_8]
MLQVTGLCRSYGDRVIFDDVSFTVGTGERVGLVGRNGHGKTTLFRLIDGEEKPDAGILAMPRGYRVGRLAQHISFTEKTVLEEACLSLPVSIDGTDESYKVKAILNGLGLSEECFDSAPQSLSGGFQVRLCLAKVLVSSPNLLLLDEPTNYLDIVSIRWLSRFLRSWNGEMMIITHDREFMDGVSTHTLAIHRCGVRKIAGSTSKLYHQIAEEEEIYEKTRVNEDKKRQEVEKFIERFRAKASKAAAVQSRVKMLEKAGRKEELAEIKTLDFSFNSAPFLGKYLFEARDLSFGYTPDNPLFEGLNFSVTNKDRIAVIGKNGRGKTTLLNVLANEFAPTGGAVERHQALRQAYFGQTNIDRLDNSHTVEEELIEAHPDHNRGWARRIAAAMMFSGDDALKKISVLSGGERSRVLLGKLLFSPANMLLLDEPTNHLDMHSVDSLVAAVTEFDGAVIIVTHSEMIIRALATRLIVFDAGRVEVYNCTYDEFLAKKGWHGEAESTPSRIKTKEKGVNKKEERRQRAALMDERAKTLGPMKKRMVVIEAEIAVLEEKMGGINEALVAASELGAGPDIAALSKTHSDIKESVDSLYDELNGLHIDHDIKAKEYEQALKT